MHLNFYCLLFFVLAITTKSTYTASTFIKSPDSTTSIGNEFFEKTEFLIRLKIPDTVSHLFTTTEKDIKQEISLLSLLDNKFWKENIMREIIPSEMFFAFDDNIVSIKSFSDILNTNKSKSSVMSLNSTITDHFIKLVELQTVLKNIDITQHIHFNGFEAIKASLDLNYFNTLKLNPFIADIDTNEKFQAFNAVLNLYEDKEEEEEENFEEEEFPNLSIQYNAPRHLARMSRRYKIEKENEDELQYYYKNDALGTNVSVYILDTGISIEHPQIVGRARHGASFVKEGMGDFNGHGSHVAGIVGSTEYGVCKECELVEVKCLNKNGQGDLTTVISAIEFAVSDMLKNKKKAVANLSLGSFRSKILNEAVRAATDNGLVFVVAAGNNNMNACMNSPASEPVAITVGAIDDESDLIASFSNWGECVDIFASGIRVESISHRDYKNSIKFSGTSMATPSVAGLAAILLDSGIPADQIKDKLIELSSKNMIRRRNLFSRPRTPNRLLFNGVSSKYNDYNSALEENLIGENIYDFLNQTLTNDECQISDVPIQEILKKRDDWSEPSFNDLQKLVDLTH
ncbi:hypothetical protein QEN19_003678 [Hanseniaspora menglaensis]